MKLVKRIKNENHVLPIREIRPDQVKSISNPLAKKILDLLVKSPLFPKALAHKLGVHEQKIYYHIRQLEHARIIERSHTNIIRGAQAHYYKLTSPGFALVFGQFEKTRKLSIEGNESTYLEPFIQNGQLHALIVVGSPDPHGPLKARSRDGYYGMDLALFLGSFLTHSTALSVRLDTEMSVDMLRNHLIVLGGPVVNNVTHKINSKLPVFFDEQNIVVSRKTGKKYYQDEIGVIVKLKNPFDKTKQILLIAGRRHQGTRACMIAFLRHFDKLVEKKNYAVVEGLDLDSDGIVDEITFLE